MATEFERIKKVIEAEEKIFNQARGDFFALEAEEKRLFETIEEETQQSFGGNIEKLEEHQAALRRSIEEDITEAKEILAKEGIHI